MKSDIELILETQTWKNNKRPPKKIKKALFLPKPLHSIPEISPIEAKETSTLKEKAPKKSFLAIQLNSISNSISNIIKNDEIHLLRIPTFPKSPFGIHSKPTNTIPTFKILSNSADLSADTINAIKYESGRIKRLVSKSFSKSSAEFHKIRNFRDKKEQKNHSIGSLSNLNY